MIKLLKAIAIIAYWVQAKAQSTQLRMYKELFPETKQMSDNLEYVKGAGGKQVALAPSAYDAPAYLFPVDEAQKTTDKLVLFRSKKRLTERQKQDYKNAEARNMPNLVQAATKHIMDQMAELPEGAEIIADQMAGQLLSTGLVAVAANGVNLSADYGVGATQKVTLLTTAKWSDLTNSTPIADIATWCDTVENNTAVSGGERPTRAICTVKTFNYIKNNVGVKALLAASGSFRDATRQMIIDYVKGQTGVDILVYNRSYKNFAGSSALVFPDEIFTLLPAGAVGKTVFGITPEEYEMGKPGKDIALTGDASGICIKVKEVDDEVENTEVKASVMLLPSGEDIGKIYIATVHS